MNKLYFMLVWVVTATCSLSLTAHAQEAKTIDMKSMTEFNVAVISKFSELDKAKKTALVQKINKINQKVAEKMQSLKALKPIFAETISLLKKEKVDTTSLEMILQEVDQNRGDLTAVSSKFNTSAAQLMIALSPTIQKRLTAQLMELNAKLIESPEINKEVRAAMDHVVKLLKEAGIATADLEQMY